MLHTLKLNLTQIQSFHYYFSTHTTTVIWKFEYETIDLQVKAARAFIIKNSVVVGIAIPLMQQRNGKMILGFLGGSFIIIFFWSGRLQVKQAAPHTNCFCRSPLFRMKGSKGKGKLKKWSPTPSFLSVPNLTSHLLNFLNSTVSLDADQATRMRPHFIFILHFICLFVVEGLSLLINCVSYHNLNIYVPTRWSSLTSRN